ncbi:unnamed protein product [marine sediment metagenome]|uniref:Uncharacterized protein n=1 Tax=marine sediment metagenome TaxID=412755 RepID=X1AIY9_9ZZZZ
MDRLDKTVLNVVESIDSGYFVSDSESFVVVEHVVTEPVHELELVVIVIIVVDIVIVVVVVVGSVDLEAFVVCIKVETDLDNKED